MVQIQCWFLGKQMENKKSSRYNLTNYIFISAFNEESAHNVKVKINGKAIFEKELTKNHDHQLKITESFDYKEAGPAIIEIQWDGEQECEKKFMKIKNVIVNDQTIESHSVMITPIKNDYIRGLLSTKEGTDFYNKHIFNPGKQHGWYGNYKFKFLIDPDSIENSTEQAILASTGIKSKRIYSDQRKMLWHQKATKK